MYIIENANKKLVEVEIIPASSPLLPDKKDGWAFDWKLAVRKPNTSTYILRLNHAPWTVQGAVQLEQVGEMLLMKMVEIAPWNIGRKNKQYQKVAGCLIAFACRQAFDLQGGYKGFLAFDSKTKLIEWYRDKYRAKLLRGIRMYIAPEDSKILIKNYL